MEAPSPELAPSRDHCPTTGKPYPPYVSRKIVSGIEWTFCPYCMASDGMPQPHPYFPEAHDDHAE